MGIRKGVLPRTTAILAVVLGACLSPSCSDDNGNAGIPSGLTASFVPLAPTPPSQSMTMQPGSASGNVFSVRVQAKDVNDFFGTAFHVIFNSATAQYVGINGSTSFLNGAGINTSNSFRAFLISPGNLAVVATRFQNPGGTVPGVNVSTGDVVVLTFRAIALTSGSSFTFGTPREVCGDQGPGCEAKIVVWTGGTMVAN